MCTWKRPANCFPARHNNPAPVFHPEFGRFMLEATPGKPWGIDFKELLKVEPDMRRR
jgi:glutamate--cysteine ligase catalytic subunit